MYDTTYEFAVDAKSAITGQWRGWSESTTISTLSADAVTATEVSIDPACDGGVTLNGMSGVVSKASAVPSLRVRAPGDFRRRRHRRRQRLPAARIQAIRCSS